jgi:hypothetical protein
MCGYSGLTKVGERYRASKDHGLIRCAETVITVSPSSGEDLWLKLKLLDPIEIPSTNRRGIDIDGQSLLPVPRTNSNSATHLSKDVNEVLTDLIRVQWRIKEMLPKFLSALLERYEKHVMVLAEVVQRSAVLRVVFKPRWLLFVGKGLALLVCSSTDDYGNISILKPTTSRQTASGLTR